MGGDHMTLNSLAGSIDTHHQGYDLYLHNLYRWVAMRYGAIAAACGAATSRAAYRRRKHLSVKSKARDFWHESDFITSLWPKMMVFPILCASIILYCYKVFAWWDQARLVLTFMVPGISGSTGQRGVRQGLTLHSGLRWLAQSRSRTIKSVFLAYRCDIHKTTSVTVRAVNPSRMERGNVGLDHRHPWFNDIMWQLVFHHLRLAGGGAAQGFDDVIYEVVREERS